MSEIRTPAPWDKAQVQGGGQLLAQPGDFCLSWESLKGPRPLSWAELTFAASCSMRGLLILSVLLGAVLGKEDFVG